MFPVSDRGRRLILAAAGLGFGALAIRLWGLTRQSLWVDEIQTLKYAGLDEPLNWEKLHDNLQGPLHAIVLHLWAGLFGWGELALRLPQAIASAATVPLLFFAARTEFGDRKALLGAAALAVNPFHVWYAQEVRNYAFMVFFVVLSLMAVRSLEERGGAGRIARVAGAWIGGLLCNMSFAFHAVAAGLDAVFGGSSRRRGAVRGLAIATAAAVVVLLPWEVGFWQRKVEPSYALRTSSIPEDVRLRGDTTAPLMALPYAVYTFAAGFSFGPSLEELHRMAPFEALRGHVAEVSAVAVCFGLIGACGLAVWWRQRGPRRLWLLSLVLPIVLAYAVALRNLKVFNPRYASAALPAFAMLLAEGVSSLRPRWLGVAAASGALAISVASLIQLQAKPAYWKEDARSASRILRAEMRPGDLIFVVGTLEPFTRYYWTDLRGNPLYGRYNVDRDSSAADPVLRERALRKIRAADRTFIVFYREAYNDPGGLWESFLKERFPIDRSWDPVGIRIWRLGAERVSGGREGLSS